MQMLEVDKTKQLQLTLRRVWLASYRATISSWEGQD
jgi:hypothetical protein